MAVSLTPLPSDAYGTWTTAYVDRVAPLRARAGSVPLEEARANAERALSRLLPFGLATPEQLVLQVVDGEAAQGEVWVGFGGDGDAQVHDVRLEDAGLGPAVRTAVGRIARERGATRLELGVVPGDPSAEAFVSGGGFTEAATNMVIDLPAPASDGGVELRPMGDEEFVGFMSGQAEEYAAERAAAGESVERAREVAAEQLGQLVPDGLASEGQHFFTAYADGVAVGSLWLATPGPRAFVYDVVVDPAHRRRGHGRSIMTAAADWCHEHGAKALGLNVFGHNTGARALYDQLGYRVSERYLRTTP